MIAYNIFDGTPTGFEPDALMTRAMTAQVLYNLGYYRKSPATSAFRDVSKDNWFFNAVSWASANNIVTGGNGVFRPNDAITRQELVTVLFRYAKYDNCDVNVGGDLSGWPDADSVSEYARDAMAWAVDSGIIEGKDGKLAPRDFATRAEVAAMMMRYVPGIIWKIR